jgi:hypothetical protein
LAQRMHRDVPVITAALMPARVEAALSSL